MSINYFHHGSHFLYCIVRVQCLLLPALKMVLLTQSQVSVILSSTIIFLFTFALFLSGYVLQQRTVTDLRAAVRPSVANFAAPPQPPPLTDAIDNTKHEGDFLAEYYDKDAQQQLSHEKLPYILDTATATAPTPDDGQISPSLSKVAHLQEHAYTKASSFLQRIDKQIHRWISRIQGKPLEDWEEDADWEEGTPIEQLSAQQRRRRIKMDFRRLGVVEDGQLKSVYRPRKRTG